MGSSSSSSNQINISKTNSLKNQNTFDIIQNCDNISINSNSNKKQKDINIQKSQSLIDINIISQCKISQDKQETDQMIIQQNINELTDQIIMIKLNCIQILEDNLDFNKIIEEKFQFKKQKFFEIFNQDIILRILSFLSLTNLSKFATLSRFARKITPIAISEINIKQYSNRISNLKSKNVGILIFCKRTVENQTQYKDFINKQLQQIQQDLENSQNNKNQMKEDIINFLIFYIQHNLKQKLDSRVVIKYILSKGIKQIFIDLESDYVKPINKQIIVPQIQQLNQTKPFEILVSKAVTHIKQQFWNQYSQQDQLKGNQILKTIKDLENTIYKKKSFLDKYNNSILHLRKTTNIFEYLNKNNIQIIIKFLTYSDIQRLIKSNKSVKYIVQQGITSILENNKHQVNDALYKSGLSKVPSKCLVYNLYFSYYQLEMIEKFREHHCYLEIYKVLFNVLNDVLFSKLPRYQNKKKYLFFIPKSEIKKIENTLELYTDNYIETNLSENYKHQLYKIYELRNHLMLLQKFLIYRDQHQAHFFNIKQYLKFVFELDQQTINYLLLLDNVKLSVHLKILKEKKNVLTSEY